MGQAQSKKLSPAAVAGIVVAVIVVLYALFRIGKNFVEGVAKLVGTGMTAITDGPGASPWT